MKAIILIGGFGTRLRPLTCTRPKALFPIVNKPLLQWTLEKLAQGGVTEVILAVNKLTKFHIKQQRLSKCGLKIKFSLDPPKTPLGTAGPIKKAEKIIGHDEPFLVLNGDLITEISYSEILQSHAEGKAVATIALHEVEDPSRYGVAELADGNRIKRFIEKPPKGTEPSKLINAGVYVLSPKIFEYIPTDKAVSMEREVFPRLAEEKKLYGHQVCGLWIDIGKPEDYLQTNKMLLESCADKNPKSSKFECKEPVALGKGVSIGEKSVIGPCTVLGKNVTVGRNVQIRDSVVFEDAKIGDDTVVVGALIGEAAYVGKKARISEGCIVADHAKVKDGAKLHEKVSVCPAKEI
ncbi:MAG: NDP-sugar synthase [Candidatus Bathyarchaeota archaeon]|nr:NDP-sugar synthase [Candidatus Bathyarchaeota archaeon]